MKGSSWKRLAAAAAPMAWVLTLPAAALEGPAAETAVQGADPLTTVGLVALATALSLAGVALSRSKTRRS